MNKAHSGPKKDTFDLILIELFQHCYIGDIGIDKLTH